MTDNQTIAHRWASQSQEQGNSHNGNFYFRGRILYSFRKDFPVGVIMGANQVVLNSDIYSISTSAMQSSARIAVGHMTRICVPSLKSVADTLSTLAFYVQNPPESDDMRKSQARAVAALISYIEANAAALQSDVGGPYVSGRMSDDGATWIGGYSAPAGKTRAEALLKASGVPAKRATTAIQRGLATAATRYA